MAKQAYGLLVPLLEKGATIGIQNIPNVSRNSTVNSDAASTAATQDAVNPDEVKIRRAKVKMFFDKLQKNAALMGYLNFTSPIEQAQAITSFAELVGVPKSQVVPLLTSIKKMATY